ncbi:MarR family winged helix-turn-helix transcriptional regulator [Pantoea ananatis]|uniref:MarR family winged helix-turn-helix transcriptional regulator n=1 Tax=Pantoea ananas TaxID=553 RepID=UPI001FF0DD21|nr:MarR family transcriptional regulator [Pantoea ananatis]
MLHSDEIGELRFQLTRLTKRLRQISQNDPQSWSRMLVISAIDRMGDNATPSALAMAEDIYSSNLAVILKQLEEEDFVERKPDRVDRRKVRIRLTDKGRTELALSRKRRDEWLEEAIRLNLSQEEAETLFKIVPLLARITDQS